MSAPAGTSLRAPAKARCWCQNEYLDSFSEDYARCDACGTLVCTSRSSTAGAAAVEDEDLYGPGYWLERASERQEPDIHARARDDLAGRNLYWLDALLRYRPPPGRTLELGASHGGFVALMGQAGFDATGLELSPAVAHVARATFDVPMLVGPIEQQDLPARSFDVVVLMDVLEHLADPVQTLERCQELLGPDGVLMIQTPCWRGEDHAALVARHDRFLAMLRPREHVYLYSERSVQQLLTRVGACEIAFEPAIFPWSDMFLFASRAELLPVSDQARQAALEASPAGRIVAALLRLFDEVRAHDAVTAERLALLRRADEQLLRASPATTPNVPFDGYRAVTGIEPPEGPYPQWDLPIVSWGGGEKTVLAVPCEPGARNVLAASVRTDLAGQALTILWDGAAVLECELPASQAFTDFELELPAATREEHQLTIRYAAHNGSWPAFRAVLYRRLQVLAA